MRVLIPILLLALLSCESKTNPNIYFFGLPNQNLTTIPDSVFSMVNLKGLYLGNSFVMYPPLSALPAGPNGSQMNKINHLPGKIARLQNLKVLYLTAVDLRSLPKEITELHQLDTLDISFNTQFKVSNELATLEKMPWLKYLNIVGTNTDEPTIEQLQKSLPNTKIETGMEGVIEELNRHQ